MHDDEGEDEPLDAYRTIKESLANVVREPATQQAILAVVHKMNRLTTHAYQFLKLFLLHGYDIEGTLPEITRDLVVATMVVLCEEGGPDEQHAKGEDAANRPAKRSRPAKETTKQLRDKLRIFHHQHYKATMAQPAEQLGFTNKTQLIEYEAREIVKAYNNNIRLHFVQHLNRFLEVLYNKREVWAANDKERRKQFFADIQHARDCVLLHGAAFVEHAKKTGQAEERVVPLQLVGHMEYILPRHALKEDSVYLDIRCSPQCYLACMIYMGRWLEEREERILNVFPLRSAIVPRYLRLDTVLAIKLLLPTPSALGTRRSLLHDVSACKHAVWSSLFKLDAKCFAASEANKYQFAYQIQTDGVACSILWIDKNEAAEKNKRLAEKRERASSPSVPTRVSPAPSALSAPAKKAEKGTPYVQRSDSPKAVIGVDPGKSDLIYCSSGTAKHDWFRYSQNQRRRETGTKKHQRRRKRMAAERVDEKSVVEWETELSNFSRKALTVSAAKAYFTKKNEVNAKLFPHYEQVAYRVLKWRAFVNRQRSEARMINRFRAKFGGKHKVMLAWGDWSVGSHHMRFHEPTMSVGLRKLFTRAGYEVVLVHESYTSRRCFGCEGGECVKFRSVENPRPWMREKRPTVLRHGLLSCKNCKRLWNRDRNGSLNIMRIAQAARRGEQRPSYLSRNISEAISAVTTQGVGLPTTAVFAAI